MPWGLDVQDCGHMCQAKCHHPKPPAVPKYTAPMPAMAPGIQLIKSRKAIPPAPPPAVQVWVDAQRLPSIRSAPALLCSGLGSAMQDVSMTCCIMHLGVHCTGKNLQLSICAEA